MQKMKDSGIEWIGQIPEDWNIKRLKAVLCERNESNNPIKTDYILSLTNDRGVIPYDEKGDVGNKSKEDVSGYKLAHPNDIVLNSMNVIIGSVALSKYYGCVSPVYYMLYPRNHMDDVRYYNYIFQTKEFQSKLKGYGNGIMEIRMRIQMSKLNTVELPIPDATTQTRIADFLDEKCGMIDRYIEKQQQVIEKLNSYKMSLITENAISNYMTIPLRHLIKSIEQGWSPPAADKVDESIGWSVLSLSAVKQGKFHGDAKKPIDISSDIPHILELHNNDFLMTRSNTRELVGDVCIVEDCSPHMIFSDLIYRITFKDGVSIEYMRYALLSSYVRQQIQEMARGSSGTMPKISHKSIKELRVPLLEKEEQGTIVQRLNKVCSRIDKIICQKETIIKKLTEYKKSLIYEAVTGKMECNYGKKLI